MAAKISTKQTFSSESSSISKEIDESVFVTRPKQHRVIGEGKLIHESDSSDDGIPKKIKDCLAEKRKQTINFLPKNLTAYNKLVECFFGNFFHVRRDSRCYQLVRQ